MSRLSAVLVLCLALAATSHAAIVRQSNDSTVAPASTATAAPDTTAPFVVIATGTTAVPAPASSTFTAAPTMEAPTSVAAPTEPASSAAPATSAAPPATTAAAPPATTAAAPPATSAAPATTVKVAATSAAVVGGRGGANTNTSATTAGPTATAAVFPSTAAMEPKNATSTPMASPASTSFPVVNATSTPSPLPIVNATPIATPLLLPNATSKANTTNSSSSCFPGSATVELESGAIRRMDEIIAGDRVKVASGQFSNVFMFTHKLSSGQYDFVSILTSSGSSLELTAGHYLYVNGALSPASEVVVGDELELGNGGTTTVDDVSCTVGTGLYNPQTLHGDIVVDGVRTSTYTTAVEPRVAHAGLSFLRWLHRLTGVSTSIFNDGADRLAAALPSGTSVY